VGLFRPLGEGIVAIARGVALPARQERATDALDAAQLVKCAADGDGLAWERLVYQYARLISAILENFELEESDAAEVAQATRLRLLERIHRQEHADRDALSCLPPHWQYLLDLLMANPPASSTEISG
jgi:hypothetical protein